ncbi:MAG TPA: hypothetical protein VNS08_14070 [Ureibacillus sp.]|nr:hypothetical protein [Ureibacillus sp.]
MSNISLNELIQKAVTHFKETSEKEELYFTEGTELEILTNEGKEHILESIISVLEKDLAEARERARKLLVEKGIVKELEWRLTNQAVQTNLSERSNELQQKYQEEYAFVRQLEKILIDFRRQ